MPRQLLFLCLAVGLAACLGAKDGGNGGQQGSDAAQEWLDRARVAFDAAVPLVYLDARQQRQGKSRNEQQKAEGEGGGATGAPARGPPHVKAGGVGGQRHCNRGWQQGVPTAAAGAPKTTATAEADASALLLEAQRCRHGTAAWCACLGAQSPALCPTHAQVHAESQVVESSSCALCKCRAVEELKALEEAAGQQGAPEEAFIRVVAKVRVCGL